MYDMLKVIFGAIVVGDFLLAIMLLALWNLYRLWDCPPPLPDRRFRPLRAAGARHRLPS